MSDTLLGRVSLYPECWEGIICPAFDARILIFLKCQGGKLPTIPTHRQHQLSREVTKIAFKYIQVGHLYSFFFPPPFRSSLEKKNKAHESTQWLEMHKKKCQAMSKSVTLRAKAMDPHKSLEEVFKAKLKENRSVSSMCQRAMSWDPADHWP